MSSLSGVPPKVIIEEKLKLFSNPIYMKTKFKHQQNVSCRTY